MEKGDSSHDNPTALIVFIADECARAGGSFIGSDCDNNSLIIL